MDKWLDIMGDVGALLGSGNRLREAVRVVTDGTLGLLSRSLPAKNNTYSQNTLPDSKSPSRVSNSGNYGNTTNNTNPHIYAFETAATSNGNPTTNSTYVGPENQLSHQQTPYPAATQYSTYPEPAASTTMTYTPQQTSHAYSNYPTSTDPVEAPLLAAFAAQASQVQANAGNWQRSPNISGTQASWQQWTNTLAGNLEPQDCFSASALVQLGGRGIAESNGSAGQGSNMGEMNHQVGVNMEHGSTQLGAHVTGGMGTAWPLNIFDIGQDRHLDQR